MSRIEYRMNIKPVDNSGVVTRQVRRRRAVGKDWPDNRRSKAIFSTSKYMPHNGKQEMARRVRQMA